MAKKGEKDLFHGQGNQTAGIPSSLKGPTRLTDPHTSAGKVDKSIRKVTQKGWNK